MVDYARYTLQDIPMMLIGIKRCVMSFEYRDRVYDDTHIRVMLTSNVNNKNFFCHLAFKDGVPIGGLCASVQRHIMSPERYAEDHFLYIIPEYQSRLRVSTELVAQYVEWAKERDLKRIRLTQSNGNKPEKFTKFAKHFGFELLGGIHERTI